MRLSSAVCYKGKENIKKKTGSAFRQRQLHGRQNRLKRELQGHCEEVYVDPGETIEEQEKRIMKYKKMVRNIVQKKGVCLKSPLSWYFRQGPRWPTTESMDQKTPL